MAEENLWTVIVARAFEDRSVLGKRAAIRLIDPPPGQDPGQCDDVLLRVPAIGAERVQLHDLAREILVQSFLPAARAGASRGGAECVVKIDQHRRMLCRGEQQVPEAAERKRTDRLLLVIADPHIIQPLAGEDVEMVEPEVDHDFVQLPWAKQSSEDARLAGIPQDDLHPLTLSPLELRIGLEPTQTAQRPVKLAQLHRVELQGVELGETPSQLDRRRDGVGVELLRGIALDPYGLDVPNLLEGRAEGEPIEEMDDR